MIAKCTVRNLFDNAAIGDGLKTGRQHKYALSPGKCVFVLIYISCQTKHEKKLALFSTLLISLIKPKIKKQILTAKPSSITNGGNVLAPEQRVT